MLSIQDVNAMKAGYLNIEIDEKIDFVNEILRLKKEKNAIILAHYYQDEKIQAIADFVGDSLGLSQQAAKTTADVIVFAGVHFMAETAKIINPQKIVLLPDLSAGCSLADSCPPDLFKDFISKYPDHVVVTYINCSAEIKALSDIVCTSSNAEKIINSIPKDKKIIFAPDRNLGKYMMDKTGRDLVLWDGSCIVHEALSVNKILKLMEEYPEAKIIAHPESVTHLLEKAHFIGSTAQMIDYVKKDTNKEFIIATEASILYKMSKEAPDKLLIAAPSVENNACACSECSFMKLNTLKKLYLCLKYGKPEIMISENIRNRALLPIQRMLELS